MTLTVKRQYKIELDAEFTEAILVTAFDASYGGANYWLAGEEDWGGEGDDREPVNFTHLRKSEDGVWQAVTLIWHLAGSNAKGTVRVLDERSLARAVETVLNTWSHNNYVRSQLQQAIEEEDAGSIDADVADVIVQVAALGEVVYG